VAESTYYPVGDNYWVVPSTIYAQFACEVPNPCRKYHVSADLPSAAAVADLVLPFLAARTILHKVVRNQRLLARQTEGDQRGKFITIYMNHRIAQKNDDIIELGRQLLSLQKRANAQPCPWVPRSRRYSGLFIEQPLDEAGFIYGGFECRPDE
jgi:hypothetical protein